MSDSSDVADLVLEVFYSCFGEKYRGVITEDTSMDDIQEWDSMSFVSLIMAMVNKLNIKFTVDEAAQMYDYRNIKKIVLEKMKYV